MKHTNEARSKQLPNQLQHFNSTPELLQEGNMRTAESQLLVNNPNCTHKQTYTTINDHMMLGGVQSDQ
jgi:t-SNARE complex subunit (syntaxin)